MSRRITLAAGVIVAAGLLAPVPAPAINYVTTSGGITWDVNDAAMPGLDTGSIRATTDNSVLSVGGLRVSVAVTPKHRMDGELLRGLRADLRRRRRVHDHQGRQPQRHRGQPPAARRTHGELGALAAAARTAAICVPGARPPPVSLRPITTKCTSETVSPGAIVSVRR